MPDDSFGEKGVVKFPDIYKESFNYFSSIDFQKDGLNAGAYYIRIVDNDGSLQSVKVIKQ